MSHNERLQQPLCVMSAPTWQYIIWVRARAIVVPNNRHNMWSSAAVNNQTSNPLMYWQWSRLLYCVTSAYIALVPVQKNIHRFDITTTEEKRFGLGCLMTPGLSEEIRCHI